MRNSAEIKSFGTNLRRIREQNNLSQQQLADLADLAKITIQRIENAKFSVTLDVIISLAKALNLSPYQLLEGIEITVE